MTPALPGCVCIGLAGRKGERGRQSGKVYGRSVPSSALRAAALHKPSSRFFDLIRRSPFLGTPAATSLGAKAPMRILDQNQRHRGEAILPPPLRNFCLGTRRSRSSPSSSRAVRGFRGMVFSSKRRMALLLLQQMAASSLSLLLLLPMSGRGLIDDRIHVTNPVARHVAYPVEPAVPTPITLAGFEDSGKTLEFLIQSLPQRGNLYDTSENFRSHGTEPKATARAIEEYQLPYKITDPLNQVIYVSPSDIFPPKCCYHPA